MMVKRVKVFTFMLAVLFFSASLAISGCVMEEKQEEVTNLTIEEVMEKHESELMEIEGVVGVGIGESDAGVLQIEVYVDKKTPELEKKIPSELGGYSVEIVETGEITAQ